VAGWKAGRIPSSTAPEIVATKARAETTDLDLLSTLNNNDTNPRILPESARVELHQPVRYWRQSDDSMFMVAINP
jgi:hypothetical protein